jgi:hypothetical protein
MEFVNGVENIHIYVEDSMNVKVTNAKKAVIAKLNRLWISTLQFKHNIKQLHTIKQKL